MKIAGMITLWLSAMAFIAAVSLAEALLRFWALLVVAAVAALGAYALGRVHGRGTARLDELASRLDGIGREGEMPADLHPARPQAGAR